MSPQEPNKPPGSGQDPLVWLAGRSGHGIHARVEQNLRILNGMGVRVCSKPKPAEPPAAIWVGALANAEELRRLVGEIDQCRQIQPTLPVVVEVGLGASFVSQDPHGSLVHMLRTELLPRATLAAFSRVDAAAMVGSAALTDKAMVEHAAHSLQAMGCSSIAIAGVDVAGPWHDDYIATHHAQGWLSAPHVGGFKPVRHGGLSTLAAAAALAQGFVTAEALILAKMAATQAARETEKATDDAGGLDSLGLSIHHLPGFSLPGRDHANGSGLAFAPLAQPALGLYAVMDSADWIERVLAAGVRTVQLRVKDAAQHHLRSEVRRSVAAARQYGAQLFINDHWQLAMEEGAYGVHLGQEDLATADLDTLARSGLRLGISTHAYWEVCRAWALRPSYIACGPIHATNSKDMPWLPQGNNNLAYWSALLPVPVVGIAGMNAERVAQAAQCGAASAAVITAITAAESPEAAISQLQKAFAQGRAEPALRPPRLARPTLRPG